MAAAAVLVSLNRLNGAHRDASFHLMTPRHIPSCEVRFAGGAVPVVMIVLGEDRRIFGSALPPSEACASALEAAWNEGGEQSCASVVLKQVPQLLQSGVAWKGKWEGTRSLFELLGVACAPPSVIDSALAGVQPESLEGLTSGACEALRSHRHHLLEKMLDLSPELVKEPRLVATACYAKNLAGLQVLLKRGADPCKVSSESTLRFPADDPAAPKLPDETQCTPLALAVRGRAWMQPNLWATGLDLVRELLSAGASASEGDPMGALLGQGWEVVQEHATDEIWTSMWKALADAGARPQSEPFSIAARPEYAQTLFDGGFDPPESEATSAISRCAMRATLACAQDMAYGQKWQPIVERLLKVSDGACTEVVDSSAWSSSGLEAIHAESQWPSPLLEASLHWKNSSLAEKCLTQPVIDAFRTWKQALLSSDDLTGGSAALKSTSLLYKVGSGAGGAAVENALRRGARFHADDTIELDDGVRTTLGPVGALALAAAGLGDADLDGQAALGTAAATLLELGVDDPKALASRNGTPGGLDTLEALAADGSTMIFQGLEEAWWTPVWAQLS